MSRLKSFQHYLPPVFLVVSLLGIYLRTLAPGLSWANAGSDGGDLIAAASTGGVAHPTGYPLYLILARFFQLLPVGSLAFRTNLMSAVLTALAAALVYSVVTSHLSKSRPFMYWPAGMAAGYAFGLAPLIWSQAVITEVYALQALLILLIIYLYTQTEHILRVPQKRLDCWHGLVLGLGVSNHVTTILIVPVAFLLGSIRSKWEICNTRSSECSRFGNPKVDATALGRQLVWFGAGLSPYLIIPIRALSHPSVNWGNAVTMQRFWWLVSGQLYQSYYLQSSLPEIWGRIQAGAALLFQQFGLPGIVLGLFGLAIYGNPSRLYILTGWIALVSLAFSVFYRSEDSFVYLIPLFISFAIWIGFSIAGLMKGLSLRLPIVGLTLGLLLIAYFLGRSIVNVSEVDASGDRRAEIFGREVLTVVPENAMIFAKGDQAVFALWYFHFALGERPDVTVMASDLLHFDWYQELLRSVYPSLTLPGPFPWPQTVIHANPFLPVCYIEYSEQAMIDCSTPDNTG